MKSPIAYVIIIVVALTFIEFLFSLETDYDDFSIRKINIQGNRYFSDSKIRSMMDTRTKGFIGRLFFWQEWPALDNIQLGRDLERITYAYQREGYLDIEIEPTFSEHSKDKIILELAITEHDRVTVKQIYYQFPANDIDDASRKKHLDHIRAQSNLSAGDYYNDEDLKADLEMITGYFDQSGYAYISVDYSLHLDPEKKKVTVNIIIEPGETTYFGDIHFEGLVRTDIDRLKRAIVLNEGDLYNPQSLAQTRDNLQSLGLFRFVSVNARLDRRVAQVPVEIFLRERETVNMDIGFGYGLEENLRIFTEITKHRFLGGVRTGTLFLKHSSLEPVNVDLKITQPMFPSRRSNTVLNPFYRQEKEPAYEVDRMGINTSINHKISDNMSAFITHNFEDNKQHIDSNDVNDSPINEDHQKEYYRKSSISLGLLRDTSTPQFFPNKGYLVSNTFTLSGVGLQADYSYLRNITDFRHYQTINSSIVFAGRIKFGFIDPLADTEFIPFEDRFYAGGAFSVRGWQRAQLGPVNADGDPVGGKSYLEGSFEVRHPLWRQLSAVMFFDYGNVWEDEMAHDIEDLHYAAGYGLRYSTPVGPVRIDVATPVFEGRKPFQLFLSLGQTF